MDKITTIDEYISNYDGDIKERLIKLREIANNTIPNCEEKILWGIPYFRKNKNIVSFAVCKNHIGFYPGLDCILNFKDELEVYKTTKAGIQLPHKKPIPYELVEKIIAYKLSIV